MNEYLMAFFKGAFFSGIPMTMFLFFVTKKPGAMFPVFAWTIMCGIAILVLK